MRHGVIIATALCAAAATRTAHAQESSVEGHLNYSRTTQAPHSNAWGAGAQYGLTFGSKHKPQLATNLGVDYMKQEQGGPTQVSGSLDVNVQVPAGPLLTPYVGGSVGINRTSGGGQSSTDPGYNYIVGTSLKLESQSPLSLRFEVRPGYVRGQPHTVTGRFGVNMSL
jgi:Outer membrane protein beta-barrel domain